MTRELVIHDNAVRFGERLAASNSFKLLFRDGMGLVEETAAYLDGEGRDDAKALARTAALAYASESMRLTTRLMQIASWLLLQRAVNEGEMTYAEASSDKRRTRLSWQKIPAYRAPEGLPARLVELINGSLLLQDRIARLDGMIDEPSNGAPATEGLHPLEGHLSRIRDVFCTPV